MSPEQALELLDRVASEAPVNRATQFALLQAVKVLRDLITPPVEQPAQAEAARVAAPPAAAG